MLMVSPTITWTGPVMLIFAAIVPVPPWKMLVAGFLAASMDPLGMVVWKAAGRVDYGPLSNVLVSIFLQHLQNCDCLIGLLAIQIHLCQIKPVIRIARIQ